MSAQSKASLRKFASLENNLRVFSLPRAWMVETANLLLQLHAGSHAVENRDQLFKHRKLLIAKRRKTWSARRRLRRKKKLSDQPPYSRAQAYGRRTVLKAYLWALSNGLAPALAQRFARAVSVFIFNKAFSDKHLRRIVAHVEACGGIASAPIKAFATERSVPHRRNAALKKAA